MTPVIHLYIFALASPSAVYLYISIECSRNACSYGGGAAKLRSVRTTHLCVHNSLKHEAYLVEVEITLRSSHSASQSRCRAPIRNPRPIFLSP
jgi:hypothetical protein